MDLTQQEKERLKRFTLGEFRKLTQDLPDETTIIYELEDEDTVTMTYEIEEVKVALLEKNAVDGQRFDFTYFVNPFPNSVPVVVIRAHEGKLMNYTITSTGPGSRTYTPILNTDG